MTHAPNALYYGDCLAVMREMVPQSVDLIYLDPPFNSDRTYHAIYKDETGMPLPDQLEAFNDMWTLDGKREKAILKLPVQLREAGIDDATVEFWRRWLDALRVSQPKMLAYLSYMVERLVVMRDLLKPTGSIFLHCDPTASHYLKVMMDGIFGHENFRNEVVWKRTSAHNRAHRFGPVHDVVLFYSAGDQYLWNNVYQPYDDDYIAKNYRYKDGKGRLHRRSDLTGTGVRTGSSGSPWRGYDPTTAGRHWALPSDSALPDWFERPAGYSEMNVQERLDILDAQGFVYWPKKGTVPSFIRYLSVMPGVPVQDVITDVDPVPSSGAERMGYETQKPLALLERIIAVSSNDGGVVLDPFCGCATTLEAAHSLGRRWIGIDIAIHAIKRVVRKRLRERLRLVEGTDFNIGGIPRDIEGVQDLWQRDPYHFQKWAVEAVDGFVTTKRGADGGIDGRLYFHDPAKESLQSMTIEVKGGKKVKIDVVRGLSGVLKKDGAQMAGLILLHPLGKKKASNFEQQAAADGDLVVLGKPYPRIQILTAQDILNGKRFDTPSPVGRKAQQNLALPPQG